MYCLLFYDYVENVVERRQPFREGHLGLANAWVNEGKLILGGALADPVDGAVLLFRVPDPAAVEEFVRQDPYVESGIVKSWRIRPWTVVVGSPDLIK